MSTVSARLDRIPFTRFHAGLLIIGGLGYMFDAMDVAIIAFVLPIIKLQWHLSSPQLGLIAAASSIGGFAGALIAGWLGDLMGRRAVMMWALAVYGLATLGSAMAGSWETFLAWRVLAGVGTSAEAAIIAPFLAEFAGPSFRGRYIGALTGFFSFGFVLAALLGYAIVPLDPIAWRYALVITALPICMLLWWRRALPDSPRWLEGKGRIREANEIVTRIESEFVARGGRLLPVVAPQPTDTLSTTASLPSATSARHAYLRLGAMILTAWFAIGFSYYAFFTWIPSLLVEGGLSITKSYGFSIAIYLAQIPGYFTAAWLNDIVGRRAVVASYMVLGGMAALALAVAESSTMVLACAIVLSFFMNGTYAGIYAYTPELFPTAIRARAQGIAGASSRVGAILSPILVGYIFPVYGFIGVFGLTASILMTGAASVIFLGVRTRARSLEDITSH